ncbi:MAG: hypothetical protein ACSHW7_07240 [Patiriisocius sp.]|uniref:hypothetical protein n=1 Tax=Patiriisocius sp. TaxID=2822396 RepID=UPI003EFAD56D
MKTQIKLMAIAGLLAFASCSKDATLEEQENLNLQTSQSLNAKEQTPNSLFDTQKKGIYTGVIAAANTQDRGVIWINAENNGTYNAYVEMVSGEIIEYTSNNSFAADIADRSFTFVSSNGSFVLDLNQSQAVVKDVTLNNNPYFVQVAKATSTRMPVSRTGTFTDPENPSLTGTWNLMTNGTVSAGAVAGEEELSLLMVTYNGMEITDTEFESFDFDCYGIPNYVPGANSNFVFAISQTSDLGGAASWSIHNESGDYYSADPCGPVSSGVFNYTDGSGTYDGVIMLD